MTIGMLKQDIAVDPSFSVYGLVDRVSKQSTVIQSRYAMQVISYEIENATLKDGARTTIFSSFQRLSKFIPQVERYTQLAAQSQRTYVFGIPDVDVLPAIPNLYYVPLKPYDRLAQEWFLVSYGADYYSALATEELSHIDDPDDQRKFRGVWTFELDMVTTLYEWLAGVVGISNQVTDMDQVSHDYAQQIKRMGNTANRLTARIERLRQD
ncbi:MAG: DICT sensory domain-containing protein [Phototrophicaceae bacterium]|jgi:DICT domain-containing protein